MQYLQYYWISTTLIMIIMALIMRLRIITGHDKIVKFMDKYSGQNLAHYPENVMQRGIPIIEIPNDGITLEGTPWWFLMRSWIFCWLIIPCFLMNVLLKLLFYHGNKLIKAIVWPFKKLVYAIELLSPVFQKTYKLINGN